MRIFNKLRMPWAKFWMLIAGRSPIGRFASWMAALSVPPYHGRQTLRYMNPKGYISPFARICHDSFSFGSKVFIGDRATIYQNRNGGRIRFGEHVGIFDDVIIENGHGASIEIGSKTRCQLRTHIAAYVADIIIGEDVGIAQGCSILSHNHGKSKEEHWELTAKGPIVIEDGAWLGASVKVLSGVTIGKGAMIATGSVVTSNVPPGMIAAGVPARVLKPRSEMLGSS